MVCDEQDIGGNGEYCGGNDAHLDRINVFQHEASGGEFVPCTVLFDHKPGVIGAVTLSRRSANSSARTTSWTIRASKNWVKDYYEKVKRQYGKIIVNRRKNVGVRQCQYALKSWR